jgi:hypothetical protein
LVPDLDPAPLLDLVLDPVPDPSPDSELNNFSAKFLLELMLIRTIFDQIQIQLLKRPDPLPDSDLNNFSAKFLLEIFFVEISSFLLPDKYVFIFL